MAIRQRNTENHNIDSDASSEVNRTASSAPGTKRFSHDDTALLLIVVDATWNVARKMVHRLPPSSQLPRVSLAPQLIDVLTWRNFPLAPQPLAGNASLDGKNGNAKDKLVPDGTVAEVSCSFSLARDLPHYERQHVSLLSPVRRYQGATGRVEHRNTRISTAEAVALLLIALGK